MKQLMALSVLCASLFPLTVIAEDKTYLEDKTVVRLSETASKEVAPDRLKTVLRFEFQGKDSTNVQNRVNKKLAAALKTAKKESAVKTSTGTYNVQQVWNSNLRRHDAWKASQTLMLDSANQEALLELAGTLQKDGFMMNGLSYYLSLDKAASMRDELITASLKRVQNRVKIVSKQLGLSNSRIAEVNVDRSHNNRPQPMPMMRNMAMESMSKSMAAPVAAAADQTVGITVNAVVHLW